MDVSIIVSSFALLIAVLAYIETARANKRQAELIDREIELVRIQISEAKQEKQKQQEASISARLLKLDRNTWKLRVFNSGKSSAYDVELELDDQNHIISTGLVARKFPMQKLEAGQSVEVSASVHLGSPDKEWLKISWKDGSGKPRSNRVEITI